MRYEHTQTQTFIGLERVVARKLPAGITQLRTGKYAVRPYDRATKKKGGKVNPSARAFTCDEWVEHWTSEPQYKRHKASTNAHNAERVSKFAEDFKGVPLTALPVALCRKWAYENEGRVPAVKAMLSDAVRDEVMDRNPFIGIKLSARGPGRKFIQPMTVEEVEKLAKVADAKWPDWPVMGAMIRFAAYSGLRRGEMLALRWTDLDWENGTILVERQFAQKTRSFASPKNGQARSVAFLPQAQNALRPLTKNVTGTNVWYSTTGKFVEPALHDYYWRQVRERFLGSITQERAEAIDLAWHTLRHFCASYLVDKGV